MADDIYLYLTVSLGLGVITLMLYVLVRLLDWSKNRALPGSGKPIFNAIVVSLVALVVVVVLLDIELTGVWDSLRASALMLVEEVYVLVLACVGIVAIVIFGMLRRVQKH